MKRKKSQGGYVVPIKMVEMFQRESKKARKAMEAKMAKAINSISPLDIDTIEQNAKVFEHIDFVIPIDKIRKELGYGDK